jgi:tRNA (Thr-GGU) A37 N-methylase
MRDHDGVAARAQARPHRLGHSLVVLDEQDAHELTVARGWATLVR